MHYFFQILLNGVVFGSIYVIFAVGYSMCFSIFRVINFAHGELYMVGAYMTWIMITRWVDNYWLALLWAVVVVGLIGFIIERGLYRYTYGKGLIPQLIVSLAIIFFLQEAILVSFGGIIRSVPVAYPMTREFFGLLVADQRLLILGITILALTAVWLFFNRTRTGKGIRASAGNKLAASMMGINNTRMASYTFILAGALAGLAGALMGPLFPIDPFMGGRLRLVAIIIIVTAGLGSIGGAVIIGFIVGIVESLFAGYVSIEWAAITMFVVMIVVLQFKAEGLWGK